MHVFERGGCLHRLFGCAHRWRKLLFEEVGGISVCLLRNRETVSDGDY